MEHNKLKVAGMTNEEDLIPGRFYWVLIVNDPDCEEWEMEKMPARYAGNGKFNYLGEDGESDWPVRWVGREIVLPDSL